MNLSQLTIVQSRQLLDNNQITSRQLTEYYLQNIDQNNSQWQACLLVDHQRALQQADLADYRLQQGETGGVLGLPYLAKDNFLVKNSVTTAASMALVDYIAPYSATVIDRLEQAGAVLLGKTNLDELAIGSTSQYSAIGPTVNYYNSAGFSEGSAVAVAADFCSFALSSDELGATRYSAASNGVFGLRSSYGAISRYGLITPAGSLSSVGIIARSAQDIAQVLLVIKGGDGLDKQANLVLGNDSKINWSKIKIGWPSQLFEQGSDQVVIDSLVSFKNKLIKQGVEIINLDWPMVNQSVTASSVITMAEASSSLARLDGLGYNQAGRLASSPEEHYSNHRSQKLGHRVQRQMIWGSYFLRAGGQQSYYQQAQVVARLITKQMMDAFRQVDFILTPAMLKPGGAITVSSNPLGLYQEDGFWSWSSLSGCPAIIWPIEKNELGWPISLQLMASQTRDYQLLELINSISTS